MAINYTALKTELETDPIGYGYAPFYAAGDNGALADMLNLVRDGTNGGPAISIRKSDVASKDIWEAIAIDDFPALPANPNNTQLSTERRSLSWLEGLANIQTIRLLNNDGSNTPVIANLQGIFPAGTGTRNRLIALASRNGSRAEQLFGANVRLTNEDIAKAREA
jgi:hypothetical protein